jgi:hypothetical protein
MKDIHDQEMNAEASNAILPLGVVERWITLHIFYKLSPFEMTLVESIE